MLARGARRALRIVGSLFGAVMMGVGTLFQPKTRPDDHWSKSPKVEVVSESEQTPSGPPPRRRIRPAISARTPS
jgi:hypothetical protein